MTVCPVCSSSWCADQLWCLQNPHVHINHSIATHSNKLFSQTFTPPTLSYIVNEVSASMYFRVKVKLPVYCLLSFVEQHKLSRWLLYCVLYSWKSVFSNNSLSGLKAAGSIVDVCLDAGTAAKLKTVDLNLTGQWELSRGNRINFWNKYF